MASGVSEYPREIRTLLDGSGHRFEDLPEVEWKPNGRAYAVSALHIPEGQSVVRCRGNGELRGIAVRVHGKRDGTPAKVVALSGTIALYKNDSGFYWRFSDSMKNQLRSLYEEQHAPSCAKGNGFICPQCPEIPAGTADSANVQQADWLKGILNGTDPLLTLTGPIIPIPAVNVPTDGNSPAAPTGLRWVAAQISRLFSAIWSLFACLANTLRSCCARPANV